jgi:hypothetical protein
MKRFEYKTIKVPTKRKNSFSMMYIDQEVLNETLKDLGEQAWDLVSTINHEIGGSLVEVVIIFKREV